jgi:hypothetical protein
MRKTVTAVVGLMCFALVGCGTADPSADKEAGSSASTEGDASASAEVEASASAEAEAEKAAEREAAEAAQKECQSQLGDLVGALKQIDGRLDVGLTNADLGSRLGDVAVAYNDIPFKKLSPTCVQRVGVPLEAAYNEYNKSHNKWNACIDDYYCSVEGAKLRELQNHWSKASAKIARADGALSRPAAFKSEVY